jgi:hypothetical protein
VRDRTKASLTVVVGFQDGGAFGFFKKAGNGPWQAGVGGVPVPCADVQFFPRTVLVAWSLPTADAAAGC